jgi:hypothetical protein
MSEDKNKNQQPKDQPKTGNDPKPLAHREQKRYSNVNESFGDSKKTQENLEKSFIHTDNPLDKPKR